MDGNEALVEVPAKVSASEVGVEVPVISKERWEEMRRMRAVGQSVSQIARETGLDRKTVRASLGKAEWVPYRRLPVGVTVLAPHMAWLAERAPQVHYSARILFQELRANHGYAGGYDTVKIAVRPLRAEAAVASLTQRRFETGPGEQAQVDWGQVRVRFAAGPGKVHILSFPAVIWHQQQREIIELLEVTNEKGSEGSVHARVQARSVAASA